MVYQNSVNTLWHCLYITKILPASTNASFLPVCNGCYQIAIPFNSKGRTFYDTDASYFFFIMNTDIRILMTQVDIQRVPAQ